MKTKETNNYKLASSQRQKYLFRLKSFSLSQFIFPPYFMQKGGASWIEVPLQVGCESLEAILVLKKK